MKSLLATTAGILLSTIAAQSAVILADDFTGVSKTTNVATITSYNTQNGIIGGLSFTARVGTDGTGAAANYKTRPAELDPNSRNDAGWNLTSSFALDAGTQTISLTSLTLLVNAVDSSSKDRKVDSNTPTTWTLSITGDGSYGTQSASVLDTFAAQPSPGTDNPVINLSTLGDLVAGENYTYRLSMKKGSSGTFMFVTLENFSLEGTITPIPEPSSTALLGLGFLGLAMRRRR